jgi:hypothetical protein
MKPKFYLALVVVLGEHWYLTDRGNRDMDFVSKFYPNTTHPDASNSELPVDSELLSHVKKKNRQRDSYMPRIAMALTNKFYQVFNRENETINQT